MEDSPIFAFVLMPFDSAFDDLYRFGIKEPAEQLGIVADIYRKHIGKDISSDRPS